MRPTAICPMTLEHSPIETCRAMVRWSSPHPLKKAWGATVRGTYGTPGGGYAWLLVLLLCPGPRGKLPWASGT